jgi:transcriptional regulator of arginine metabolism
VPAALSTLAYVGNAAALMYTDSSGRINMKPRRLSAIKDIVEHEAIRSQEQLRQRLAARGFVVTQATLSRDIKEIGLVKRSSDGAYQADAADGPSASGATTALARALSEYLAGAEPVQQLIVLRTGPGQAQLLGLALDRARLPGVVGTIAGDDTILVIARDARNAQAVVRRIDQLASGGETH